VANHCFFHCSRQDRCNGNRLKSAWRSGTATFGTGVMLEAFHSVGTVDVVTDWLNKLVSGLQNTAAPSFKKIWQGKPAIIMSKKCLTIDIKHA